MIVILALVVGGLVYVVSMARQRGEVLAAAREAGQSKAEANFPHPSDRPVVGKWVDLTLDDAQLHDFWSRSGLVWSNGEVEETPQLVGLVAGRFGPVASCQMVRGQTLDEWQKAAPRMASMLGTSSLSVSAESPGVVAVEALIRDPLAQTSSAVAPIGLVSAATPIPLGRTEHGDRLTINLADQAGHIAIQGQTRSGKSALMYLILTWAAHMPDVRISGFDHSQILLGPLGGLPGRRAIGSDMTRHLEVMTDLLAEMDERITGLAVSGRDKLTAFTQSQPLLLVVCEEWPGLIRSADAHDKATGAKPADRIGPKLEAGLGRLVSEGAKAGIRVLLVAQRASSQVINTDSRANFASAITLRSDPDGVAMLHKTADKAQADRATQFVHGRGYFESPWESLTEWQADYLGEYDTYTVQLRNAAAARGLGVEHHV